tara:strand:+ start:21 stop:731 length:711 start_codon:yes stop_codon:yes gene_type:complete
MYKQKEKIGEATLYLANAIELMPTLKNSDLVIYDPPFELWKHLKLNHAKTTIAFCSPKSRHDVENCLGKPRTELVWHFADGRWVSNNLPRITHDYIYIYGKTSTADVGEYQYCQPQNKGLSAIGKDVLGKRYYKPKARKHLNSVQILPRNMSNPLGSWGKPCNLIKTLIEWIKPQSVLDPFMGSGTTLEACYQLGIKSVGIEIEQKNFDIACKRLEKLNEQLPLLNKNFLYQTKLL